MPHSPLIRVIFQARFPPILSIRKEDTVSEFQEAIRDAYPYLRKDTSANVTIGNDSNISEEIIWRFVNSDKSEAMWCVSLGVNFVALETIAYQSRDDFLARLRKVLISVENCFKPATAERIGLRYVDQLKGDALERAGNLVQPGVFGILQPDVAELDDLRRAVEVQMTQVRWVAKEGLILGQWGNLAENMTYAPEVVNAINQPSWVLDLDMFTENSSPFESEKIIATTEAFSKRIYAVFRQMVTDEFLKFFGGTP